MVDNISLRTPSQEIREAGEIKGLDHTEALQKLSGGIDGLEDMIKKAEANLKKYEGWAKYEEGRVNHFDGKIKNANGWDKFWGNDDSWRKSKNYHAGKLKQNNAMIGDIKNQIAGMKKDLAALKNGIKAVENAMATELAEKTAALKEALKAGDLAGAIMLVLGDKAQGLKGQVDRKMAEIDDRNKQSADIDRQIAKLNPKDEKDAKKIKALEADQNELNSMNQTDMIRMQTTLNRYNQTNEMMSNLIQKLSRAMDSIISNMK